ncbi:hypothetical protein EDC48_11677 [Gibbsiella quercinecans]|uniref:Uncharacterized protein n=1 Tax=Gibbsiella quercinecans TaxID=929813 RepID=A0A250B702_9GAMM|nr:hypothetical protein [Gibbsiella quercinecans]ATA21944.1 hypothetical protein AWC35_22860 [Gibbsiella quercinecans]RLM04309.1 hypothetical protein BIY27_22600 [Gibbsiella quercinecans]RLM04761.1 hypothetical protein BIY31_18485 [Gibbsiella quercinecans]RLM08595.1 hypothetical protein BIY30_12615 [Gibbsiella quercinecans]TCT84821.1 hypothetical protein EDC48_11677 [Gibbsiella quercinecans]
MNNPAVTSLIILAYILLIVPVLSLLDSQLTVTRIGTDRLLRKTVQTVVIIVLTLFFFWLMALFK